VAIFVGIFVLLQPGWPDWGNFCLLGDCFLWAVFFYYRCSPKIWSMYRLFPR
jgi:hypothetical protein